MSTSVLSRRQAAGAIASAVALAPSRLRAADLEPLDVAYAGSMSSLIEGPIKALAARRLGADVHGRPQGAAALAKLIVGGAIAPDVFISVTPGPMHVVLDAGAAATGVPIARTAMVIAYAPHGPFADRFAAAARGGTPSWWQLLETPGIRFGRTDPTTDPQGRNIIYTMQLAAKRYGAPDLVEKVLGPTINPAQIFGEPTIEARLQAGQLDAASAYKVQPIPLGLPYVTLPREIDLADDRLAKDYAAASLVLDGKTFHPQPLVYYAAALAKSAHAELAAKFVALLLSGEAQAIFAKFGYDAAATAAPLAPKA